MGLVLHRETQVIGARKYTLEKTREKIKNHLLVANAKEYLHGRVLDVGCANGSLMSFCDVDGVGIDVDIDTLKFAKAIMPVTCAYAEHMPYASGVFDYCVLNGVVEYVYDLDSVISECLRVLKDGGEILILEIALYPRNPLHVKRFFFRREIFDYFSKFDIEIEEMRAGDCSHISILCKKR